MNTNSGFGSETIAAGTLPGERMHLSENELDDHLLGDLSPLAAAHLAACECCTQRVAQAAEPIADFRAVTMAWSERRSATMPMPATSAEGAMWQRHMGWAMATGVLALGIALTGADHGAGLRTALAPLAQTSDTASDATAPIWSAAKQVASSAPAAAEAADRSSEPRVSADNRMLKAIDNELDASIESPATLGLEPVGDNPPRQQRNSGSLED